MPLFALGAALYVGVPASAIAQDSEPSPEEAARQTPIIVEGTTEREPQRAQTGSRIAHDPDFTDLPVATSTGINGLTPGAGISPLSVANRISRKVRTTCVSDTVDIGERASCLLIEAREALAADDASAASDIYRFLASSEDFSAAERLTGGTELYNLAGTLGDAGMREEALIRLVDSGVLPQERQADARRSLVTMALTRDDKLLAIERLEQHLALSTSDAQSFANLAILRRETGQAGDVDAMRRAIAIQEAEGEEVPRGWSDFVAFAEITPAPDTSWMPRPATDLCSSDDPIFAITEPVPLNPDDTSASEVGELIYRGGVVIEPGEEEIGGISGLHWHEEDGKLYAVSDDGHWLTIEPDEFDGQLIDILEITMGDLLDERGRRLRGRDRVDAEAITRTSDNEAWLVAFERDHRIWSYPELDGPSESTLDSENLAEQWPITSPNAGLESLADGGSNLSCVETYEAGQSNCVHNRVPVELAPPAPLVEHGGVPTDAACNFEGTCYVLFRSYREGEGNRAAILKLPAEGEPETLATFLPPLTLDNFEGLAVREQFGKTFLYIVSDNNFSDDQRTLLMKFEIKVDEPLIAQNAEPEIEYDTTDVVLETSMGDITIRLETERAPITAANFLRYIDEDRFDGTVFYRAMKLDREPQPNGLIQGGTQFDPNRILPGITHEPTTLTGLSHTNGALSMAMGEPGSANGDFSIMLADQTGLDARPDADEPIWKNGYAVFGYVIEGMDVVSAIHALPADPSKGEGMMVGQILADPVEIIDARRVPTEEEAAGEAGSPTL